MIFFLHLVLQGTVRRPSIPMSCDRAVKSVRAARPVRSVAHVRTIQLIISGEEGLQMFPGRRNNMMTAALINGSRYSGLVGVLAMAWGWLQRGHS